MTMSQGERLSASGSRPFPVAAELWNFPGAAGLTLGVSDSSCPEDEKVKTAGPRPANAGGRGPSVTTAGDVAFVRPTRGARPAGETRGTARLS